tara:strand:- start:117 stop:557 length:441 start_codon:yes stop_codon:yes gene_type:complete
MNWTYQSKEVTSISDLPEDVMGFVYVIEYEDGTYYFGQKNMFKSMTLNALKNGETREGAVRVGKNKGGKRVYFDLVTKESNWLTYEGSSEATKDLVITDKTILDVAYSKRSLTYLEAKRLFIEEALEDEQCHNLNILGKFFKGNID